MNLSTDFRERAEQQRAAATVVLESTEFDRNPRKQAAAIVGQVNATVFDALADMVDYLRNCEKIDDVAARRRAILERNDAIRRAAAVGNWDEFDKLTGVTGDGSSSSDAQDGGGS